MFSVLKGYNFYMKHFKISLIFIKTYLKICKVIIHVKFCHYIYEVLIMENLTKICSARITLLRVYIDPNRYSKAMWC